MTARRIWLGCVAAVSLAAVADDGMWTYHDPPVELLRTKHRFEVSKPWLDHLRLASISTGASASFISADGLYLTNAHVALGCARDISTERDDFVANGFLATERARERHCPGVEARQLVSYADVTRAIDTPDIAERRRRISAVESDCREKTGLRCEVVTLFRGAQYWLYRYKVWNDVRLVFQPENDIAFFGGDTDNFVFPRFTLDVALLRVYEGGKPAHTPDHLRIAKRGAAEGDLVFSSGSPGSTDRELTLDELLLLRDRLYPLRLQGASDQREALVAYAGRSPESARRALSAIHGTENFIKVLKGETRAMAMPALVEVKSRQEEELRAKAQAEVDAGRFRWKEGDPWRRVDRAVAAHAEHAAELQAFGYGFNTLVRTANNLVALAYEGRKPDGERLRDYREARVVGLRRRIAGDAPVYKDLESARLASQLRQADRILGPGNAFVAAFTHGESIDAAAHRVIAESHLDSAAERRKLLEGGAAAIDASTDPLIAAVRSLYPRWSELERGLDDVEAEQEKAHDEIARVRAHLGTSAQAPDATGTLRFAFGEVRGYDRDGVLTPWTTTFHGLYDRHVALASHPYFDLPPRWKQAEKNLDLDTPLVFVTTVDIIGGSSGSPLVNREGELVGVLFDGNLEELGNRFAYSDTVARSLAVDMRAMVEALDKVYGARGLLREIDAR